MLYSFFCRQKTIKNRQALHEIIRASSLSILVYHSWKMYFQVKILTLDIFTHMPPPPSAFPLSSCSLRRPWVGILGYFIWFVIFSNVMTLQFCKYIAFCHIAWEQSYCPLLHNHNLILKLYQIKKLPTLMTIWSL